MRKSGLNLKVRVKNPVFWTGFLGAVITFIYTVCGLVDVVPPFTQSEVVQGVSVVISALTVLGVLIDPTTKGLTDSKQALTYTSPKVDVAEHEEDE